MKNNQKGFGLVEILIVLVVVGVVAALGFLVYDRQKSDTNNEDSKVSTDISNQQQTRENFQYADVAITSDWKTYENEEYGFSFKYPADFRFTEGQFDVGQSADKAVFYASAATPVGQGGYEIRVLKTSLEDAVKEDALNTNGNLYEDTIIEKSIYKNNFRTIELSYVPEGGKVSWFFIEKDSNTVIRFALVEDTGVNADESKAIYNSLVIKQ